VLDQGFSLDLRQLPMSESRPRADQDVIILFAYYVLHESRCTLITQLCRSLGPLPELQTHYVSSGRSPGLFMRPDRILRRLRHYFGLPDSSYKIVPYQQLQDEPFQGS
jgi:hypothetical protein